MEYRVNGTVRVWFSTVVEAESAEEARDKVECDYSPEELLEESKGKQSELSVFDVEINSDPWSKKSR